MILIEILSQWAWFSMSTRNFIDSGQNSAHPLLYDRWIARSAITYLRCTNTVYRVKRLYANRIYERDERHAIILVSWIETFIFMRGVIIQVPMK